MDAPPISSGDLEKGHSKPIPSDHDSGDLSTGKTLEISTTTKPIGAKGYLQALFASAFVEVGGIHRVLPEERQEVSGFGYVQMVLLWFSANLTVNNLALGLLGPLVWELNFLDCAMCATFGALIGSAGAAYTSMFGPISGNRTMVISRYTMGWWPSRLCVLLDIVILLGYGMIDCVIGGQILSAVADNNMSIVVGVIIVAIITWVVTVFGLPIFHVYLRYAWAPQLAIFFILVGVAGPSFNTSTTSVGDKATVNANRLSFLSLCLSAAVAWAPSSADYYVYYKETTPRHITFLLTWVGLTLSLTFVYLLGAGVATGVASNTAWAAADKISPGALIVAVFEPLGAFGKFCGVIAALGVIANNVPGTYSAGLCFQCLGSWPLKVPRMVWNTFGVIVYTICAAAGRNHLFDIFENFLALMGYWVTVWITIMLEEQLIFRHKSGYDWSAWNSKERLPYGFAALTAFLVGWAGSIICMDQVYYVGPVAKLTGEFGADMGIYVGVGFAAIVYPGARFLEKKFLESGRKTQTDTEGEEIH